MAASGFFEHNKPKSRKPLRFRKAGSSFDGSEWKVGWPIKTVEQLLVEFQQHSSPCLWHNGRLISWGWVMSMQLGYLVGACARGGLHTAEPLS